MIFHTQPTGKWEPIDFALLEALTILEQEICGGCGNYVWMCDWRDNDVQMKTKHRLCRGQKAIRERQNRAMRDKKQQEEDAKGRPDWGMTYYAYPELDRQSERTELPTRKEYFEKLKEYDG